MSSEGRTARGGSRRTVPARSAPAVALITSVTLLAGCGAKGPPRPPLPKGPTVVRGAGLRQSGSGLELWWQRPRARMDGGRIEGSLVYEILARAIERPKSPILAAAGPAQGSTGGMSGPAQGGVPGAAATPSHSRADEDLFLKGATVVARVVEESPAAPASSGTMRKGGEAPRQAPSGEDRAPALSRSSPPLPGSPPEAPAGPPSGRESGSPPAPATSPAPALASGSESRTAAGPTPVPVSDGSTGSRGHTSPGDALDQGERAETPAVFSVRLRPETFPDVRWTAARLQIAVVAVDARGRRSRPRPLFEIDPVEPPAAPDSFRAEATRDGVLLSWSLGEAAPGLGVNVYRASPGVTPEGGGAPAGESGAIPGRTSAGAGEAASEGGEAGANPGGAGARSRAAGAGPATSGVGSGRPAELVAAFDGRESRPIEGSPFTGSQALDASARVGESYAYHARAVVLLPGAGLRESEATDAIRIDYLDTFPPGPPVLVTVDRVPVSELGGEEVESGAKPSAPVSEPVVLLVWSPPIDPDIGGYRIYRGEEGGEFTRVAEVPAAQTRWQDRAAGRAKTGYRYRVTAVDRAAPPNEGPFSETAVLAPEVEPDLP